MRADQERAPLAAPGDATGLENVLCGGKAAFDENFSDYHERLLYSPKHTTSTSQPSLVNYSQEISSPAWASPASQFQEQRRQPELLCRRKYNAYPVRCLYERGWHVILSFKTIEMARGQHATSRAYTIGSDSFSLSETTSNDAKPDSTRRCPGETPGHRRLVFWRAREGETED